jgi:hypothetical protein
MAKDKSGRFLNVDLDIVGRERLNDVVDAFGEKALVLYVGRRGRGYYAVVESASTFRKNADQIIQNLVAMVRKLSRNTRKIWDKATSREFNIGVEAPPSVYAESGHSIPIYVLQLKQKTLEDILSVNGTLTFTVYPSELPAKKQAVRKQTGRGKLATTRKAK